MLIFSNLRFVLFCFSNNYRVIFIGYTLTILHCFANLSTIPNKIDVFVIFIHYTQQNSQAAAPRPPDYILISTFTFHFSLFNSRQKSKRVG